MQKIQEIISTLKEYIKRHEIKKIYIEDYAYGISGQNPKGFVSMAEVKGVIKYFCFLRGILVEDVPISTWKKATIGFKASKKRPDEYMKKCERLAGRKFQTIDEADAYMMYLSIKAVP